MTKFKEKSSNGIFTQLSKIGSLRLTISLNIYSQNYSFRRSISPIWWLRNAALVPLVVTFNLAPIFGRCRTRETLYFEKYIVRSIVSG